MASPYTLERLLSEKQTCHVVDQWMADQKLQGAFDIVSSEVKQFADGLTGLLGDHLRVTLQIKVQDVLRKAQLFVKCLPIANKPKSERLTEWNYFVREMVMYQILEECGGTEGKNAWRSKAYICNESIVVMPDLTTEGYITFPKEKYFDLDHTLLAAASIARFHVAQVNRDATKPANEPSIIDKYDYNWMASPWLKSGALLISTLIKEFSIKTYKNHDFEKSLYDQFIDACSCLKEYPEELNVIIHNDLWSNNILFKYADSKPETCLLIDYQCICIAPPAFDIMVFLYLTTNGKIRSAHEKETIEHYFEIFTKNLEPKARKKIGDYTLDNLKQWCDRARKFAILVPLMIFPFNMMESKAAQRTYDDPATYEYYINVDRSKPVLEYARSHPEFKERMLEVSEEFVERYLLGRDI